MQNDASDWHLTIELSELRLAMETVLEHLRERSGERIEIDDDYFWSVPLPDIYDVENAPQLTIGQLSESWDNLDDERRGDGELTIAFAAVWLGDILKAVGHRVLG